MDNKWKEIWDRHDAILTGHEDFESLIMELKKANGFDVVGDDGVSFESWMNHIRTTKEILGTDICSLYEVGCGSGANLVMFQHVGIGKVGGVDYSDKLARAARTATGSDDITCAEANAFPTSPHYDAVISDSVTQYLPSLEYAKQMFDRMAEKADKTVAVLDVHDEAKRAEWQEHRRLVIDDYDKKYSGLDNEKLFISRDFFREFARKHGLQLKVTETEIENYWNGQYTYNVFMFK